MRARMEFEDCANCGTTHISVVHVSMTPDILPWRCMRCSHWNQTDPRTGQIIPAPPPWNEPLEQTGD
ncbi:MAG TPA: hypothetical protein VFA76_16335 [Terriglobales bacterium]|nr:hypothetical protein [Terriglobales bacterium]